MVYGILEELKKAILEYKKSDAAAIVRKTIEEGLDPLTTAAAAIEAIKVVGDRYASGELFLPELIGGANALKSAMSVLEEEIKRLGKTRMSLGTIVIGTVYGDIHSIGKDMVATLAISEGFQVIDIGVDVKPELFLNAVKESKPDILALSALLTTTAREQGRIIKMLKDEGLRDKVKVVVGGGALTVEFARSIGADGYEPTAPRAIKLFKEILGKGE